MEILIYYFINILIFYFAVSLFMNIQRNSTKESTDSHKKFYIDSFQKKMEGGWFRYIT